MDHIYKQPKYFNKFRCIGGECPKSCCDGWEVYWKQQEVEHLKNTECSDELKKNINESFEYIEDLKFYDVRMCKDGRCPFHNIETGLCDIQFEIGENNLGIVCRQYPRHYIESGYQILRWCVTTCPAVIDLLIDNEDAIETENVISRDYKNLDSAAITVDTADSIRTDPIRKSRNELLDFYTKMLLDKSRSFENSIILTALAIKHLTDAEIKGNYNEFPNIIKAMTKQLTGLSVEKSVEEIKPNYQLKFKLVNNMLVKFFGNNSQIVNISALHDGKELILERYLIGLENFNTEFNNKEHILRNVIMNIFFDMNLPLGKLKRPLFENYAYFVLAAASIKTVAAAIGYTSKNIREDFKKCVAEMSRSYSHDVKTADAIAEDIKQMGLTTPAHIALIIKG